MGDIEQGGRKWKVCRYSNGSLSYLHIKQALKLLLPREYISRSHQRRHWASRYLPGKEPVNQKYDIFKYCDIAQRAVQDAIESTKDGSDVRSFQLKSKTSVRIWCSMHVRDENDAYFVSEDVLLMNWLYSPYPVNVACTLYTQHLRKLSYHLDLSLTTPVYQIQSLTMTLQGVLALDWKKNFSR